MSRASGGIVNIIGLALLTLPLSACCQFFSKPRDTDSLRWSKPKQEVVPAPIAADPCQEPACCTDAEVPAALNEEGYRVPPRKAKKIQPVVALKTCEALAVTPVDRLFCKAEAGQVLAMEEIADRYHAGKGLPRIFAKAATYYRRAAESGSAYAQFMLSILYAEGRGVKVDLAKSVKWFDRGAKNPGANVAQFRVAKRYARGEGLSEDAQKAVYWYELAANKGFAPAQIEMGEAFYQGRGRPQDYEQAFDWYLRAAEQSHPYAENMIGSMLLEGQGVEINFKEAVMWTKKAAYQGARQAQYRLGWLYFYGLGVHQSDPRAYAWWKLALKDVDEDEPTELKVLIERMRPEARAQAVKLVKEFTKKYVKPHSLSKI